MQRIFADLQIADRLQVSRHDPSDTILSPGHRLSFWADAGRTVQEFQEAFPREARGISELFHFLERAGARRDRSAPKTDLSGTAGPLCFRRELQAVLALPVLGNGDLPPSLISAFSAAKICTEFLLDGGYYPAQACRPFPIRLRPAFGNTAATSACPAPSVISRSGIMLYRGSSLRTASA